MKYQVLVISRELNLVRVIKRIKINALSKKITLNNHTLLINTNNIAFMYKNINFYIVDYEKNTQLSLVENNQLLNSSELDSIISQEFLSEMMKSVKNQKIELGQKIMFFILGALVSIVISLALVNSQLNNAINDISDISAHFISL